ncbi:hypothetical protein [Parasphingopyxis marina]|uniref:Uncharacterized protein n=1 Tax=Parasphingopyxis marina TaxID=2761622 RepID=A0A842HXD6_9SPHN|nr:hypothetical protein [Parasphingopyxis marina]MBC2777123.1 hypothetical protein [Parasphingopyxis marina]
MAIDPEATCQTPVEVGVPQSLARTFDIAANLQSQGTSSRAGAGTRYIVRNILRDMIPLVAEAQFSMADLYLTERCLDEADGAYRSILANFPGAIYSSYRQRAQVGIDDVRGQRGSNNTVTEQSKASPKSENLQK